MSCCIGPDITFPRRFVPRPDTCSPLLCRTSRHGHTTCTSHGPGQPQPSAARNTHAASRDKAAAQPTIEELRREVDETNDLLLRILTRLRDFPDVAAAISEMLAPHK